MKRISGIIFAALLTAIIGIKSGLSPQQVTIASIFCISIVGLLLSWDLRLSFVFFGAGLMLITRSITMENLIKFASLDVILFLIGMMVMVGMLNDAGCFPAYWTIQWSLPRISRSSKAWAIGSTVNIVAADILVMGIITLTCAYAAIIFLVH